MNKYCEHYWKLEKYKQNFENMLAAMGKMNNVDEKFELAVYASNYFVFHNSGYYTSSVLEKFFTDYAKSIKVDVGNIQYKKNSILHVLTTGYETGGHTRVVERWIENAPSEQIHSVVKTNTVNADLSLLENNVKQKNGEFIVFENALSFKDKAIKLRKLAAEYEYVILHTHMDEPIATIAFGTEDFTRPVLLYNHASHMPWLGKSIADLVLDIENNDPVTREKRGITNTYFLGVPSKEISISIPNKKEIRNRLNISTNKKVIVSCGHSSKYTTITGKSFVDYLDDIMDKETCCYVIGVEPTNEVWQESITKSGKDIILLGRIDFGEDFLNYLKAADLYLDSYPFCGGTAVIDAISSGTPALSLKSVYSQFDYLTRTSAYCKTEKEFIDKSKKVLSDENYAKILFEELKNSLIEYQSIEVWNKRVKKLYEIAPKQHKVRDLSNVKDYSESNDLSVLCNAMTDEKFLTTKKIKLLPLKNINEMIKYGALYKRQGIPFIFQILSYKKQDRKVKIFKLFGIPVLTYTKKKL